MKKISRRLIEEGINNTPQSEQHDQESFVPRHSMEDIVVPDTWDNVTEFARWYCDNDMPFAPPPDFEVYRSDDATSISLFRKGRYQVELYLIFPSPNLPVHEHPGVEVIKMRLDSYPPTSKRPFGASGVLRKGESHGVGANFKQIPKEDDNSKVYRGFPLLAFQKWDEGLEMTTVAARWRGKTVGPRQEDLIRRFDPDAFVVGGYADVTLRKKDVYIDEK